MTFNIHVIVNTITLGLITLIFSIFFSELKYSKSLDPWTQKYTFL